MKNLVGSGTEVRKKLLLCGKHDKFRTQLRTHRRETVPIFDTQNFGSLPLEFDVAIDKISELIGDIKKDVFPADPIFRLPFQFQ